MWNKIYSTIHPGDTVISGNFSWIKLRNLVNKRKVLHVTAISSITGNCSCQSLLTHYIIMSRISSDYNVSVLVLFEHIFLQYQTDYGPKIICKNIRTMQLPHLVPLMGGTKLGVLGPRRMSALIHTGLLMPRLWFFWLRTSNDKPTESRDLKSNFMAAGKFRINICASVESMSKDAHIFLGWVGKHFQCQNTNKWNEAMLERQKG